MYSQNQHQPSPSQEPRCIRCGRVVYPVGGLHPLMCQYCIQVSKSEAQTRTKDKP